MKKILATNKKFVGLTCMVCIISSLANVAAGFMLSYLYKGIVSNSVAELIKSASLLFLIWTSALISTYIKNLVEAKAMEKINNSIRSMICDKVSSLDYEQFHAMDSGNYVSWLTNDVYQIDGLFVSKFFVIVESIFAFIFALIALTWLHYLIALSALILSLVMVVVPKMVNKKMAKYSKTLSAEQELFVERTKETMMGYDVFNGLNLLKQIQERIQKYSVKIESVAFAFRKKQSSVQVLIGMTNILAQLGLLTITVLLVIKNLAPAGAILSVTNLGGAFFSSLVGIVSAYVALKSSKPIVEKFNVDQVRAPLNERTQNLNDKLEKIEVRNAGFSYGINEVFKDVDMIFESGKKYALVGESGSGKSTLVKLLLGFVNHYTGEILYNGIEKKKLNGECIREKVAYIDQNVYLFNASVRDNITLGREYTDEEIHEALKKSNLFDFIQASENQLDMIIKENGKNLSGGQRQRIAIARALIAGKSFIILDEGTAAMDEKNATEIELTLIENSHLTTIFITHNLKDDVRKQLDGIYRMNSKVA